MDLPARHLHARGPHAAGAGGHRRSSSRRRTARAGRCPTRRSTSRRRGRRTAGSTAGSAAPGSTATSWDRHGLQHAAATSRPAVAPSRLARVRRRAGAGVLARVVDVGCGRGADALWFAAPGCPAIGLDYSPPRRQRRRRAGGRGGRRPASSAAMNLLELRSVLAWGARLAHRLRRRTVRCWPATSSTPPTRVGRRHLWRLRADGAARRRPAVRSSSVRSSAARTTAFARGTACAR